MEDRVISVESLSKRYVIGHRTHDTLRDQLTDGLRGLVRGLSGRGRSGGPQTEEFWALRDVSFGVNRGDVVGVVGRNGAGKSTLLKIISRITEPTAGRIAIRGRVASLLEVGTGFHPELTGRENIFLNGAILGMSRAEIRRKFDEIVSFAEVERFLDTPVKYYSSGMYVRLAFAVAANLEPEILIVDEVLAVGDIAFQQKCMGKMREVSQSSGRTILFVSHNLPLIRQLCTKAILMDRGTLVSQGPTNAILTSYVDRISGNRESESLPAPTEELRARAYPVGAWLESAAGAPLAMARVGEAWRLRLRVRAARRMKSFIVGVGLVTSEGVAVQTCWTPETTLEPGEYEWVFLQDAVALAADSYRVGVGLSEESQTFLQFSTIRLEISGENPLIPCVASSGYGLVLNSMKVAFSRVEP